MVLHSEKDNGTAGETENAPLASADAGTSCHTHTHNEDEERRSHHSDKVKNNLISRLNRIEGQIRGVKGMIDKDTYCDDVLNQIAAVQSALNSVGKLLLEGHMKSCVIERIQEGDTDVIDELLVTVNKLMK
ncbi:metal-sensitive transcriptional regulator [Paenibacillus sp. 1P03SA]|uniref:metal-sensitive transcriptional regulator n=1 Tax=Paenibacillus sp. 1P03SA TaxID=3132294 RepID=UPI0039A2C9A1